MQWKKDPDVRYTQLCMYIDENIPNIVDGTHPDIETKVWNYLWLIIKAIAIKGRMFTNFQDYDGYAFYAANRIFFALKKNYLNQGKTIKGKVIRPIKSCLNYTKALLYPMKVEYQREAYSEVLSEEAIYQKFDSFAFKERLRQQAISAQGIYQKTANYIYEVFTGLDNLIEEVMKKSPFPPGTADYKYIKISLLINCLNDLQVKKILNTDPEIVALWKLPKSLSSYVKVLLKELYALIKTKIMECAEPIELDDATLKKLLSASDEGYTDYED